LEGAVSPFSVTTTPTVTRVVLFKVELDGDEELELDVEFHELLTEGTKTSDI